MPQATNSEGMTRHGVPLNALVVKGTNGQAIFVAFQDRDGLTIGDGGGFLTGGNDRVVSLANISVPAGAVWMIVRSESDVTYNLSGAELTGLQPGSPSAWTNKTPIAPVAMMLLVGEMLAVGIGAVTAV